MAKHRTNKDSSGRNGRGMDLVWGWYGVVWGGMGWDGEYVLVWGWYGDGMGMVCGGSGWYGVLC